VLRGDCRHDRGECGSRPTANYWRRVNDPSSDLLKRLIGSAHRGSKQARPISLNRWITSRTESSSAAPPDQQRG
jgi:hypothetical protein